MDNTVMFKITYGLFVLTARNAANDNGCIINTVGQVTLTPNCISLAVNKSNFTHDMIMENGVLNVSIISTDASFDLFRRFGFASGRDTDKFEGFTGCKRAENGVYYITEGINAVLCAKVVQTVDLGTHTLFIAEVTDGWSMSDVPSVSYEYYLSNIKPKPQAKPQKTVWRCKICGYEHEGEELLDDFICPICKHGKDDFEKVEE